MSTDSLPQPLIGACAAVEPAEHRIITRGGERSSYHLGPCLAHGERDVAGASRR